MADTLELKRKRLRLKRQRESNSSNSNVESFFKSAQVSMKSAEVSAYSAPAARQLGQATSLNSLNQKPAPEQAVFDNPIQSVSSNGIVVYSFKDNESLANAREVGTVGQNAAIATEVQKVKGPVKGPEEPNPGSPVGNFKLVGPGDRLEVGPNKFNDKTLEIIDLNGNSPRYKGNINLKPSETLQGKIQVQELVSEEGYPLYVVEAGGNDQVFFEALRTAGIEDILAGKFPAGENAKTMVLVNTGGKLPEETMDILGLKSAKGLKKVSAPSTKFKSSAARGSYESPTFGRRAFTSRPDLRFGTSQSEYDPFGGSETGKYSAPLRAISQGNFEDMTKAELIQLISQLDKEDEREELNESRRRSRKNVIKLTEGDLYKIVDRVLNENKEGKGCAESEGGSGCIKKKDGQWVIMNNKKGGIFKKCSSKKDCEEILAGYHASK